MAAADDIKKLNDEIASLSRKLGKGPLKVFDPAEIREAKAALSGLKAELSEMEGSATNLYEKLRGITTEFKGQETATAGIRKAFRSISADATKLRNDEQEIEKLSSKELKTLQQRVSTNKDKVDASSRELINTNKLASRLNEIVKSELARDQSADVINEKVSKHLDRINTLTDEQKAMLASYFDQNNVIDEILDKTKQRLEFEEKIDKKVRGFTALADLANSIPGLRKLAGPFQAAEKAARKVAEEGGNGLQVFTVGGKALLNAFGPITLLLTTLKFLKDVVFGISKQTAEIGKSMGLSAANAEIVRDQMVGIQNASKDELVTTGKLLDARTQLSKSLGTSVRFTQDQLLAQIKLTERVGIQADEAANIQKLSMLSNQSTEESLDGINSQIVGLAKQTGIQLDNRDILKEVSETNGQIAATLKNNPTLIGKAVIQVRKLGLTLEKARDISKGLLDFESSISSELEAELLTGKQLNLERARSLALQGDFAGAAEEVAKQVGSLAEFQNMNVIQQQALAQAAGMTADELSNSLAQTENLNRLGRKNREQLQKQVEQLKAQGRVEEANRLMNSLGNKDDLKAAQEKIDAQTQFNAALDKAKSMFADIFKDAGGLGESIVGIISGLVQMKPLLVALAALYGVMAIRAQIMAIAEITKLSAMTAGIGVLGALAGITAGVALMDSYTKAVKVDDAVINPDGGLIVSSQKGSIQLNKDDSIVAGTNLGGSGDRGRGGSEAVIPLKEFYAKMDEMIAAVKEGKTINLDGRRVNEGLFLATSKFDRR